MRLSKVCNINLEYIRPTKIFNKFKHLLFGKSVDAWLCSLSYIRSSWFGFKRKVIFIHCAGQKPHFGFYKNREWKDKSRNTVTDTITICWLGTNMRHNLPHSLPAQRGTEKDRERLRERERERMGKVELEMEEYLLEDTWHLAWIVQCAEKYLHIHKCKQSLSSRWGPAAAAGWGTGPAWGIKERERESSWSKRRKGGEK